MKKKAGNESQVVYATYNNHTDKPTSNRSGNYDIQITNVNPININNEIQKRANEIVSTRRFISKMEAAEILGCSVRTIDRRISKGIIEIYKYEESESGSIMIYKDKFFIKYGLKF